MIQDHLRWRAVEFLARDGVKLVAKVFEPIVRPQQLCIFLHGAVVNSSYYTWLAEILKKINIRTLLIDLRGHGLSIGNIAYVGQLEDDLHDILAQLQTLASEKLPIILMGHSAGASIVLRYIKKYGSDKISKSLLIAPAILSAELVRNPNYLYAISHWLLHRKLLVRKKYSLPASVIIKYKLLNLVLALIFPYFRSRIAILHFVSKQPATDKVMKYNFNAVFSMSLSVNFLEAFARLSKPTLILFGENDELIDPFSLDSAIKAEEFSGEYINFHIVPGAGHYSIMRIGLSKIIACLDEFIVD